MVSFIDCAPESDKVPVLFCGDLFNFQNFCELEEVSLESLRKYLYNFNYFKGFSNETFVFSNNTLSENQVLYQLMFRIFSQNQFLKLKIGEGSFESFLLYDQRCFNPVFNMD